MKIAVTAKGPSPDSPADERLGRAYWLMIYNLNEDTWQPVDNSENRNAPCGVGKLTAQTLIEFDVEIVITGEAGPKAFRILHTAGIQVFYHDFGTVSEVLEKWQAGTLKQAKAPNETGNPYCLMSNSKDTRSYRTSSQAQVLALRVTT